VIYQFNKYFVLFLAVKELSKSVKVTP